MGDELPEIDEFLGILSEEECRLKLDMAIAYLRGRTSVDHPDRKFEEELLSGLTGVKKAYILPLRSE